MTQPINPFQAPQSETVSSMDGPRLFTPKQAGVATFLGSALAGGVILGLNAWREGKPGQAFGYGIGGAVVVAVLLFVVPDSVPSGVTTGLGIGVAYGASALAKPAWESGTTPQRQSNWAVAGVILGALLLLLGGLVGSIFVTDGKKAFIPADTVEVPGGSVLYWDDVEEKEARRLAEYLGDADYFVPQGEAAVSLERVDGSLKVCFFVVEGAWLDAQTLADYAAIAAAIDDEAFPGESLRASLCNADQEEQASVYPR